MPSPSPPPTLDQQRAAARRLLDDRSPADAFAAYYALHHDPKRTALFLHYDPAGRADGLLVRAQTGMDLFTQLAAVRAPSEAAAEALFGDGLVANRPYYLVAPPALSSAVNRMLAVTAPEVLRVYRLDPAKFEPVINVLVVSNPGPEGSPRYEISSGGRAHAVAGLNWRSPHFAEVYVYTEPAARGRGWGKAVVSALVAAVLDAGLVPLYMVDEQNTASIAVAESLGFVDTGGREYAAQVMKR